MSEWQPVRIAPSPHGHGKEHVHFETVAWMKSKHGTIIRCKRPLGMEGRESCSLDVHPDDQHVFDGFDKYGKQTGTCEHQILAD